MAIKNQLLRIVNILLRTFSLRFQVFLTSLSNYCFFFIEMQKIQILSFSKHLALPANLSGRATSDHYINYILLL